MEQQAINKHESVFYDDRGAGSAKYRVEIEESGRNLKAEAFILSAEEWFIIKTYTARHQKALFNKLIEDGFRV